MRRCKRGMPCVKGVFKFRCKVDGHEIKFDDLCLIPDDNPKLLELFPIHEIYECCENCASYEPINDEVYQGTCPNSPGEYRQCFDKCKKFSPKSSVLEAAEKARFAPWDN